MLEDREVKDNLRPRSLWLKILLVVAIALVVINIFRVNPPRSGTVDDPPVEDTKGSVVQGSVAVNPADLVSYRISFPYSSTLKGRFRVNEKGMRILVMVLDEASAEKYRQYGEYSTLVSTGRNPSGVIHRKLDAGTYYLIFDNREGAEQVTVNADFVVD